MIGICLSAVHLLVPQRPLSHQSPPPISTGNWCSSVPMLPYRSPGLASRSATLCWGGAAAALHRPLWLLFTCLGVHDNQRPPATVRPGSVLVPGVCNQNLQAEPYLIFIIALLWEALLLSSLYRLKHRGSERLRNLPNITQRSWEQSRP